MPDVTQAVTEEVTAAVTGNMGNGYFGILTTRGGYSFTLYLIVAALCAVMGYLLGSINFAVVISKVKFKDDIRKYGSGNAGATNMSRTYGKAAGIATLAGDILKTVIPVFAAKLLCGDVVGYMTGMFVALGHAFPCYYKFKGGKCVAVTAAMALTLEPIVFLFLLAIFAIIVVGTKYVSLASIVSALMYPMLVYNIQCMRIGRGDLRVIFALAVCILVVTLHKENIKRLIDGKENKFSFGKSKNKENPMQ